MKTETIQHDKEPIAIIFYNRPIGPGVHFYVECKIINYPNWIKSSYPMTSQNKFYCFIDS